MPIDVQAPNGDTVSFPDGTDDATINTAMAKAYSAPTQAAANSPGTAQGAVATPAPQGVQPAAPPVTHPDFGLGLETGFLKPFDNMATWVDAIPGMHGVDEALAHVTGTPNEPMGVTAARQGAAQGETPSGAGSFVGTVAGTAPILVATKNPWVAGAASGLLSTDSPLDPVGAAIDTASGAIFGKAGASATKFLGDTLNPLVKPAVQRLMDAGVKLTPGQITGGFWRMLENSGKYVPFLGDAVSAAQDKALTGFNNATYNQVLENIGTKLPAGITGHEAQVFTQKAIGDRYKALLPSLQVQKDVGYVGDRLRLAKTLAQSGLPDDAIKAFNRVMYNVDRRFSRAGGMTGRTMQEIDTDLGQEYADHAGSQAPADLKLSRLYKQAQTDLREMVYRNNPSQEGPLKAVRAAFREFVPIELAGGKGTTDELGRFQPGQLKTAVAQNDNLIRNRATAQGRAPGEALANDAIATMGRTVKAASSLNPLIRTGLGAGALMAHLNPAALLTGAPYTDIGGDVARWLLTGRQGAGARTAGAAIRKMAPVAAVVSAAAAPKRARPLPVELTPEQDAAQYTGGQEMR